MDDYYKNYRYKNEHNQIITDWGNPYPPLTYEFNENKIENIPDEWEPIPHSLRAPSIIGYPDFIPELQDLINKRIIEAEWRFFSNKVDDRNRPYWKLKKQGELFK